MPRDGSIETPVSVARRALKEAKGIVEEATRIMEQWVRENVVDRRLRDEILDPYINVACNSLVRGASQGIRKKTWLPPGYDAGGKGKRVRARARTNMSLYFSLPNGKALGEATKSEVLQAASFYDKQSADMAWKARWLFKVAAKMPDRRKKVKSVWSEKQLRDLQEQVDEKVA